MAEGIMSSIGSPIFISVPDESNEPVFHHGKMLESNAETFMAEFDRIQELPIGQQVHAYSEFDGKFYRQKAVVKEVGRSQPNPVMTFRRIGTRVSAEKRCSYRVRVSVIPVTGQIGDERRCSVTDLSPEGFAAITGKAREIGSAISIHVEYEGQVVDGLVRVQSVNKLPNGKHRCGFFVPEKNSRMRRSLERITSTIQRLHLRTTAGFRSLDSNVEVNGESIHAVVDGIGAFSETALKILAKEGIVNPQPGDWYNQQSWLDALAVILDRLGPDAMFNIGLKVPDNSHFPPGIDSLDKALSAIDTAFHINHRNGEIGHYYFNVAGPKKYEMVCENPYPCDFDRGLLSAFCSRFKPRGSEHIAAVTHDDARPCRKKGSGSCTYVIAW